MIKDYINKLGHALELPEGIAKEDEGVWRLWIAVDSSIVITDTPPGYHLFCKLGPIGNGNREEILTVLMVNNFYGENTGGAVLGIDRTGNTATLSLHRDEDEDYQRFEGDIEDFINFAEFWKRQIEDLRQESKSAYF